MRTKRYLLPLFFAFLAGASAHGQMAVAIATDSFGTISYQINSAVNFIKTVQNTIAQVQKANNMIQNQIKMVQSLRLDDFESVMSAVSHQARVFEDFNDILGGFDYLEQYETFNSILSSDGYRNLREGSRLTAEATRNASKAMFSTNSLIENTKKRLQRNQELNAKSSGTDSMTSQLQVQNQQMTLLSHGLDDLMAVGVASNNFLATVEEAKEFNRQLQLKEADEMFGRDSHYRQKYSAQDYKDVFEGTR